MRTIRLFVAPERNLKIADSVRFCALGTSRGIMTVVVTFTFCIKLSLFFQKAHRIVLLAKYWIVNRTRLTLKRMLKDYLD